MSDIQREIREKFERLFDRIYVVHLVDYAGRKKEIEHELGRIGLLNSEKLEWYYDVKTPFDDDMHKHLHSTNGNTGTRKLTLNHYRIMKIAMGLGYKRILIIEDDLRFLNSLEEILTQISSYPEQADICLLDKFIMTRYSKIPKFMEDLLESAVGGESQTSNYGMYYVSTQMWGLGSTACYGLTAAGMEFITKNMELLYKDPIRLSVRHYNGEEVELELTCMNSDFYTNSSADDVPGFEFTEQIETMYRYKPAKPVWFAASLYNIGVQMSCMNVEMKSMIWYHFLDLAKYNIYPDLENETEEKK